MLVQMHAHLAIPSHKGLHPGSGDPCRERDWRVSTSSASWPAAT